MTTDFSPRRQQTARRLAGLPLEEQLQVRKSATAIHRRWQGRLNVETVERFLVESMALLGDARVKTWTAVLAERFTSDRLRALVLPGVRAGRPESKLVGTAVGTESTIRVQFVRQQPQGKVFKQILDRRERDAEEPPQKRGRHRA